MLPVAVVVDTNVFIAALKSGGGANRVVLRHCLRGVATPLMGAALFAEYESVLARESLFEGCALDRAERGELFDAFCGVCRWVSVYYLWRPNLPDPADDHLVELAIAGGAGVIVTNNVRDFAAGEIAGLGVRALTPGAWLRELEREKERER